MLISVSELLSKSWENYAKNFRVFIPYMAALVAPAVILFIAGYTGIEVELHSSFSPLLNNIIIFLIFLAVSLFTLWAGMAFVRAVKSTLVNEAPEKLRDSLANTSHLISAVLINSILVGLAVFFGTLLFIIPGIIFAIWYSFCYYNIILDEKKSVEAMKESKKMVVGRWWAITWRVTAPAVVFMFISTLAQFILAWPLDMLKTLDSATLDVIRNGIYGLINVLMTPLFLGAGVGLFLSAKENPTPITPVVENK